MTKKHQKAYKVLDLFSGCGGLSYGFMQSGFEIVLGVDNWQDSLDTFEYNHKGAKILNLDLSNFDPEVIADTLDTKIDIVIGGPPCQGFSISGKRNPDDPRNKLYQGFVKTVEYFKPQAFVLENVPNLVSMNSGKIKDEIIKEFESLGYDVKYKILLAADYGVPQNRRRVIFVGIKGKNDFEYPLPLHDRVTTSEAISDLPINSVSNGEENLTIPMTEYQKAMRAQSCKIYNHEITNHSEQTIKIISMVPDGGNYKNLPIELQSTRKVHIAWTRYNSNKPSPTIDTGHRHHFHYLYNRIPTVRESARLQSFPDHFVFLGSKTSQYKQVGNAVPPLMAKAVGTNLLSALNSYDISNT